MICQHPCEQVWLLCVCFSSGVSDKAFVDPVVWLTALLTTWTAVLPSVAALALNVILTVHDKHRVRYLYEKVKEKISMTLNLDAILCYFGCWACAPTLVFFLISDGVSCFPFTKLLRFNFSKNKSINSCNVNWSLMSLSPGCNLGPQCIPTSGTEVKAEKRSIFSPFLLCPLSGSRAWTPHHFRDLHPQHSADGVWEGDRK